MPPIVTGTLGGEKQGKLTRSTSHHQPESYFISRSSLASIKSTTISSGVSKKRHCVCGHTSSQQPSPHACAYGVMGRTRGVCDEVVVSKSNKRQTFTLPAKIRKFFPLLMTSVRVQTAMFFLVRVTRIQSHGTDRASERSVCFAL